MITASGKPYLKRTQSLILKILIEKQDDALILFNDPEGRKQRYTVTIIIFMFS